MTTFNLQAPTAFMSFQAASGTRYTADANKIVASVLSTDAIDLVKSGCIFPNDAAAGKDNLTATTNPATTDDSASGYTVASVWINVTLGLVWQCVDATASAAVWVQLGTASTVSVSAAVTAFATGGQGSATALTAQYNLVTVCATAADSVKLLPAAAGIAQTVKNIGAATLAVFPSTGDAINALAVNLSVDVPVGAEITFRAIDATTFETVTGYYAPAPSTQKGGLLLKAADSAGNTTTTIVNASQAAARTYTIPDAGANASFVQTEGAQTLNGVKTFSDNLTMSVAAKGLILKQGANGLCGTFVANGVTPVTVSNSAVAVTDCIIISLNTVGGTVGVQPHVATITASTGFTVVCTATDSSTYNYAIIKNAA